MKRLVAASIALSLCGPVLAEASPDELCTMYAATLLTGKPLPNGTRKWTTPSEIVQAMSDRGITCEPLDRYMEIAKYRLDRIADQVAASKAAPGYDHYAQEYRRQQEGRRQREQQRQQQPLRYTSPRRTTCEQVGNQVECTTTGG